MAIALGGLGPGNLIHVPSAWHRRCDDAAGRCGSGFSVANLAASILIPPPSRNPCHAWPGEQPRCAMAGRIEEWPICTISYDVALRMLLFGRFEVPNPSTPTHGNTDTHAVQYPF